MAVAVVVKKAAAGAPALGSARQARLFRHLRKRSVPVVAEERVLSEIGDEQVVEAVVVIVADADGRSPPGLTKAGLIGDVGESAVAVVFIQAIGGIGRRDADPRPAQHQNVQPSVVIVIDERAAATDGLEDVILFLDAAVNGGKLEPRLRGDIHHLGIKRHAGGFAAGHRSHAAGSHALGTQV